MVNNIVFHLGDHKTGSTSIQTTLKTQKKMLGGVRILFPTLKGAKAKHAVLASSLSDKTQFKFRNQRFSAVAKKISASDLETAVISAESFEWVKPEDLKAAVDEFFPALASTARYITYLRPHADKMVSSYAENLKQGHFLGSLEEFHQKKRHRFLCHDRISRWRAVFGDRFEVRPMIRSHLYLNCVVRDFLRFTLGEAPFELSRDPDSNRALSLEDLAMLREFHLMTNDKIAKKAVGWRFARKLSAYPRPTSTKLAVHRDLAQQILDSYGEDAKNLDRDFFEGTPMFDAMCATATKALPKAQSVQADALFCDDELRSIRVWAHLAMEMSQRNPEGWSRHFRSLPRGSIDGKTLT